MLFEYAYLGNKTIEWLIPNSKQFLTMKKRGKRTYSSFLDIGKVLFLKFGGGFLDIHLKMFYALSKV